jgi:serine/threonine protein kinase
LYLKSDVYSFGVVLLEMLTGLRAYDKRRPSQQINLVNWGRPFLSNRRKVRNLMDTRLEGKYPVKQVLQIAPLAARCLQSEPHFRPSMKEVAETLEQIEARYNSTEDEPEALST